MNFYSVSVTDSSSKWMGSYSTFTTTYNMNEVLVHQYDRKYESPAWSIALSILGAAVGVLCATYVFNRGFPSFWFFALLVIGAFFGLGGSDPLATDQARRKQAAAERLLNGYTGRFGIVEEEKWEKFVSALRTRQ